MKYISISWLFINFPISFLLWHFIYKQILKKPLLSITVVDWIYQDTIIYINSLCVVYSAAIVHALTQPGEELNFEWAIFYSLAINASVTCICVSLILSGGLRLISLIKNSEASGLQLLGLDHEAIVKIRLMTISISVILLMISFSYLGAMPGVFNSLHGEEYKSYMEDLKDNKSGSLYFLMPTLALLVNATARFYSYKVNRQIEAENLVFVIFGNPSHKNFLSENAFLFSLKFVLAIPLIILLSFLTTFSS
jgi:hypothetical protein